MVGILCGIAICSTCRIAVGIWDTPPRSLLCKARISVRNESDAPIAYPIARVSGTPILQVGNEAGEIEMTVPRGATISFLLPGSMFHRYQADDLTVPDSASVQRRFLTHTKKGRRKKRRPASGNNENIGNKNSGRSRKPGQIPDHRNKKHLSGR